MIKEINYSENSAFIENFRQQTYGIELLEYIDKFDSLAHHFFISDDDNHVLGMLRILRSDENSGFEYSEVVQEKSSNDNGVGIEFSRFCMLPGLKSRKHISEVVHYMVQYCQSNNIDYAIAWVREEFLPLYNRFGFQVFAPSFIPKRFISEHYPISLTWPSLVVPFLEGNP